MRSAVCSSLSVRAKNALQMLEKLKRSKKRGLSLSRPSASRTREPRRKLAKKGSRHRSGSTRQCSRQWRMIAQISHQVAKATSLQSRSRRRAGRKANATRQRLRKGRVQTNPVPATAARRCVLLALYHSVISLGDRVHPLHCTLHPLH